MEVCVIGAGVSGLSMARLLSNKFDVTVYEKSSEIGGIARTRQVSGVTYHPIGGHCMNSKNRHVMDYIFEDVLPRSSWHKVERNAKIHFKGHFVSYPIEFSIKEIAKFDFGLALNMTKDFLLSGEDRSDNLANWFIQKFGQTLAREYFIPYNKKIWQMEPKEMSHLWVEGKLPLPNKEEFFRSLVDDCKDNMPHSHFYYPNSNNQNTFITALSEGANIRFNQPINTIERLRGKWIINGDKSYDIVISTMPLNILPFILDNVPTKVTDAAQSLRYNKVSTMLWETKDISYTWSYLPAEDTIFHRHIHIGNFFQPPINYTITESMGNRSYEELVKHGKRFDYLIKPLDYNVSDHAYVVYDHYYSESTSTVKEYLHEIGLHSIGRFGEWEYYNMDVCMDKAMGLAAELEKTYS